MKNLFIRKGSHMWDNFHSNLMIHHLAKSKSALINIGRPFCSLLSLQSWQKVESNTSMFTSDMTPLILAAHRNNYEILKILLDRGATIPAPHDTRYEWLQIIIICIIICSNVFDPWINNTIHRACPHRCGCDDCLRQSSEDSLRHSLSRVNEYRALASPSLIALSSNDPLLTAFQLSWELRNLAFSEQESKTEYLDLRRQCQKFAVDLLDQSRSSQELAIILNYDPNSPPYVDGEHMKLARLELAINYKQKKVSTGYGDQCSLLCVIS